MVVSVVSDLSGTVSFLGLVLVGILELGLGLLGDSITGIMIENLVGTVCWMETIPGSQCYERFPLDASIFEVFGRLLIPSFIFLLSSSNLS